MLRNLALALLGLSFLAGPAAARGDGPSSGRRADTKFSGSAKAEQQQQSPLLRRVMATTTVRPAATSVGTGAAACGRASSQGKASRCRGAAQQVASIGGWARGLPPALGVQARECPPGTMAVLAEGHDDVVRCIPV